MFKVCGGKLQEIYEGGVSESGFSAIDFSGRLR